MQEDRIKTLEAELALLRSQFDDLQDSSFKHFEMFTNYIVEHARDIGDLYTFLIPVIKKIYPGYEPTSQHLESILKLKNPPYTGRRD